MKSNMWFFFLTYQKGEIVKEILWGLGFQMINKLGSYIFHGYTDYKVNIDIKR